jgi:hypothetical protein
MAQDLLISAVEIGLGNSGPAKRSALLLGAFAAAVNAEAAKKENRANLPGFFMSISSLSGDRSQPLSFANKS